MKLTSSIPESKRIEYFNISENVPKLYNNLTNAWDAKQIYVLFQFHFSSHNLTLFIIIEARGSLVIKEKPMHKISTLNQN